MHGNVFADSYGINNAVFQARETKLAIHQLQAGFKFRDYYSVFDQEFHRPHLDLTNRTTIEEALSVCKPFNKPNLESTKQYLMKSIEKVKEI